MTSKDQPQEADDFAPITPAEIRLSQAAAPEIAVSRSRWVWIKIWGGLAILTLLGAGVVFSLPQWSFGQRSTGESPAAAPPPTPAPEAAIPAQPATPAPGVAPLSQTQQLGLRKESQDILAELLALTKSLQEQGIETWAAEDYAAARKLTESGDAAYRTQKFEEAKIAYRQALSALRELEERSEQVFREAMERGAKALSDADADAAARAFQTALLIKPGSAEARKGSRRAETLNEVLAAVAKGDELLEAGNLEEARQVYERALELDKEAESQLHRVNGLITDRRFREAMSQGYAALDANDLEIARNHFSQALKVKANATEARSALRTVEHSITSARIATLLDQAKALEKSEQWHEAVEKYGVALTLDPTLASAQQGKPFAANRALFYDKIEQAIARPERLADEEVYREATQLLQEARQLDNPGRKLRQQCAVLGELLEQAVIPVAVIFQSNNETEVTLYKIGNFGKFETKQITLRPGRYVAVGTRTGYRDARVAFVVSAGKPMMPVVVQSEEKIRF